MQPYQFFNLLKPWLRVFPITHLSIGLLTLIALMNRMRGAIPESTESEYLLFSSAESDGRAISFPKQRPVRRRVSLVRVPRPKTEFNSRQVSNPHRSKISNLKCDRLHSAISNRSSNLVSISGLTVR